jgi:hypothetical protein
MPKSEPMTQDQWRARAVELFGADRFGCPSCGHITSVQDWKEAGASEGKASKPVISEEAKERIRGFVNVIESIQSIYGVLITAEDGVLVLFDTKREHEWIQDDGTKYGRVGRFHFRH